MAHLFNGDIAMLDSDYRKSILPAKAILDIIGIKQGDTIIDFGSGIGYFSIPAARLVGEQGKVIAIDISEKMITELSKRAKGLDNIDIVRSDKIKGIKGDIILLVTVFHELDDQKRFLDECFDSLNQGGRLILIDWQKKETMMGPPIAHRISKEEVIEMTDREVIEHPIDDSLYFLEFKK